VESLCRDPQTRCTQSRIDTDSGLEVHAGMDDEADLPPPPPVPAGAVPARAPGYGPSRSGPNGDGAGPSGSNSGRAALAAVPVPSRATRPEYGTAGRATKLCVNYFKVRLVKAEDVYHYNVRLTHPKSVWHS
jgi:hypothetical protein